MVFDYRRLISLLFYLLAFLTPLIFLPITSELFEFNKLTFVYIITIFVVSLWLVRSIKHKSLIYIRTFFDIPIILFVISQTISTILSIDQFTSFFGYPTRFHGGLLSTIAYSLLYFMFVFNLTKKEAKNFIYCLLFSGFIVSAYGILQHFGIDDHLWHQDVKARVFSTLGQPNWLAAWIIPLILISSSIYIENKKTKYRNVHILILILLLFITLLFTKSRSGILSFGLSFFVFSVVILFKSRKKLKNILIRFMPLIGCLFLTLFIVGTPWNKSLLNNKNPQTDKNETLIQNEGGTDSGVIRQIVWKGAIDIWKNYPLFGTGVETFAYSYYSFRPDEHNHVSEWDFLYNKAHNEFLNFAANSGSFGLLTYLILTFTPVIYLMSLLIKTNKNVYLYTAMMTSLMSIVITNFFGFSVVAVSIVYFIFPGIPIVLNKKPENLPRQPKNSSFQKYAIFAILLVSIYLSSLVLNYWRSDVLYARGKNLNQQEEYFEARDYLLKANSIIPNHPFYLSELSESTAGIAIILIEQSEITQAKEFAEVAEKEAYKSTILNPMNPNIYRAYAGTMQVLSSVDLSYLSKAIDAYKTALSIAPNDPRLFFRLGITYAQTGESEKAIEMLERSISLKPDYGSARYSLAMVYKQESELDLAKEHLNYILQNIKPEDELVKQALLEIEESAEK